LKEGNGERKNQKGCSDGVRDGEHNILKQEMVAS
jgi:hypothetical protein